MANIKDWIHDKLGNIIVPKTLTSAVYDDDGTALSETLDDIGVIYKNVMREVQTITTGKYFNDITVPAGTYLVSMQLDQAGEARAMSWLEVNGVLQLAAHDNYLICTCNTEIRNAVSRVCVFDIETTLRMYNGSGHDYGISFAELSAIRLK